MDHDIIKKYCDRFETTPEGDIPNAVVFKAIAEGLKSHLQMEMKWTTRRLDEALKRLDLTIKDPLPFAVAASETNSKVYYKAVWEKMVEDAETPERAARYVLGLLEAALDSEKLVATIGGSPDNFETPTIEPIEDGYRRTQKRYPRNGLKFSAKNKGTLQFHTNWR